MTGTQTRQTNRPDKHWQVYFQQPIFRKECAHLDATHTIHPGCGTTRSPVLSDQAPGFSRKAEALSRHCKAWITHEDTKKRARTKTQACHRVGYRAIDFQTCERRVPVDSLRQDSAIGVGWRGREFCEIFLQVLFDFGPQRPGTHLVHKGKRKRQQKMMEEMVHFFSTEQLWCTSAPVAARHPWLLLL